MTSAYFFYPCHFEAVTSPAVIIFHLLAQNKTRINKAGELLVTSELSRSQQRNLSDCIQKISAIIAEASEKPREPTAEDVALRAARYYPAAEHILFLSTWTRNVSHVGLRCKMCRAGWRRGTRSDSTRRRSTQISRRADEWILTK